MRCVIYLVNLDRTLRVSPSDFRHTGEINATRKGDQEMGSIPLKASRTIVKRGVISIFYLPAQYNIQSEQGEGHQWVDNRRRIVAYL